MSESNQIFSYKERLVVIIFVCIAFVAGAYGYQEYFTNHQQEVSISDLFYYAFSLFLLNFYGDPGNKIPIALELARWLAPASLSYAAFKAIFVGLHQRMDVAVVSGYNNHAIICGLNANSFYTVKTFLQDNISVVIIDTNTDHPLLGAAKALGAKVITGNPGDTSLFAQANLSKAKYLMAVSKDDKINVDIVMTAYDFWQVNKIQHMLHAVAEINSQEISAVVYDHPIFVTDYDQFSAHIIHYNRLAARNFYNDFGPDTEVMNLDTNDDDFNIVLVGEGDFLDELIRRIASIGHYSQTKQLQVSWLSERATENANKLRKLIPAIDKIIKLNPYDLDLNILNIESCSRVIKKIKPGIIYVYSENMQNTLVWTKTLVHTGLTCPIVLSLDKKDSFTRVLLDEFNEFQNIHSCYLLERGCDYRSIFNAKQDRLAIAIHESYVREQKAKGDSQEKNPSLKAWPALPESLKDSNRNQADHMFIKCRLLLGKPKFTTDEVEAALNEESINKLAIIEHDRWVAEKRLNGWRETRGEKNIDLRLSPCLVAWRDLPAEEKQKDIDTVTHLPDLVRLFESLE